MGHVNERVVLKEYFYEWLLSKEWLLQQLVIPQQIPIFDERKFFELEMPVPDLAYQEEAVRLLLEFRLLEKERVRVTEQLIDDATMLKSCAFNALLESLGGKDE